MTIFRSDEPFPFLFRMPWKSEGKKRTRENKMNIYSHSVGIILIVFTKTGQPSQDISANTFAAYCRDVNPAWCRTYWDISIIHRCPRHVQFSLIDHSCHVHGRMDPFWRSVHKIDVIKMILYTHSSNTATTNRDYCLILTTYNSCKHATQAPHIKWVIVLLKVN